MILKTKTSSTIPTPLKIIVISYECVSRIPKEEDINPMLN
jgi:hypothetical protein